MPSENNLIDTEKKKERVVLLAVDINDGSNVDASLDELAELADTAEAEVVAQGERHIGFDRDVGRIVQVALRVRIVQVDRRRNDAL